MLRNIYIEKVTTIRFFGLNVHEHLSRKPYMDYLLRKLRISYGVVKKVYAF